MSTRYWRFCILHLCLFHACSLHLESTIPKSLDESWSSASSTSLYLSREPLAAVTDRSITSSTTPSGISQSLSLYSLQWTPDDRISIPVRSTWRWKDAVLGDGRDFFVPKPKTIQKLQSIFMDNIPGLEECSVLSNCARFAVLCKWNDTDVPTVAERDLRCEALSFCLLHQVDYNDKTAKKHLATLTQSLDLPKLLSTELPSTVEVDSAVQELSRHWDCIHDISAIMLHLCKVSAGTSERPRRPDRQVIFRPYSSRDAHILLQLKRTKAAVSSRSGVLNDLLELAIRAGKAARNEMIVPALKELKPYGSSKDPPLDLSIEVQEKVIEDAIEPLIQECLEKWKASTNKDSITTLRQAAESLSTSDEELAIIRKLLHQPTIELRRSPETVDVQQILDDIDYKLQSLRKSKASLI
ncbi:unnamed protein product [Cylindrotheca closterium]|uniref:Uncharacterized protein n=1 Tax=Cylindrotheca closterium TaxID=2856 RepID=A0AAD2CIM6_9STRA|nr:unnamed protein product [Cylindrotheca closterium]